MIVCMVDIMSNLATAAMDSSVIVEVTLTRAKITMVDGATIAALVIHAFPMTVDDPGAPDALVTGPQPTPVPQRCSMCGMQACWPRDQTMQHACFSYLFGTLHKK
jgi:hypothetical protein